VAVIEEMWRECMVCERMKTGMT